MCVILDILHSRPTWDYHIHVSTWDYQIHVQQFFILVFVFINLPMQMVMTGRFFLYSVYIDLLSEYN